LPHNWHQRVGKNSSDPKLLSQSVENAQKRFNRSEFTQSFQALLQEPNKFEHAYFDAFSLETKEKLGAAFIEFIFPNRIKELMGVMKLRHPEEGDAALTQQRCGAVCLVLGARLPGEEPMREEQGKPKSEARGSQGPTGADASSPALPGEEPLLEEQGKSPGGLKSKARGSQGSTGADASSPAKSKARGSQGQTTSSPALVSTRQLRRQPASPAAVGEPIPGHGPLGDANQEVLLSFAVL
jgi:hypothetical protein